MSPSQRVSLVSLSVVMDQWENYAKKEGDNDDTEDDSNKMIIKMSTIMGMLLYEL